MYFLKFTLLGSAVFLSLSLFPLLLCYPPPPPPMPRSPALAGFLRIRLFSPKPLPACQQLLHATFSPQDYLSPPTPLERERGPRGEGGVGGGGGGVGWGGVCAA